MGWSGSFTSSSKAESSITFTPTADVRTYPTDVDCYVGTYTVSAFTAPKRGVYRFELYGSGGAQRAEKADADGAGSGANGGAAGGTGGYTDGYLLLDTNQTVYVGAGGCACAAFVSSTYGESLSKIPADNLYFVAGGGGNGGGFADNTYYTGYNFKCYRGTSGGGQEGEALSAAGTSGSYGHPGTQSAGGEENDGTGGNVCPAGSYGTGSNGRWWNAYSPNAGWGGRGGDGYYGGSGGWCDLVPEEQGTGGYFYGGGGGSGYVKANSDVKVGQKTYRSYTNAGYGSYHDPTLKVGSASNTAGKVVVTYYTAELPITFNGKPIVELQINGNPVSSLKLNGSILF